MRAIVYLCVSLFAFPTWSQVPSELPKNKPRPDIPVGEERIQSGTSILISKYDERIHAYLIKIASNGAIGPLYADLSSLSESIATINLERVRMAPESIVTNYYTTDKELRLLTDAVVAQRRANSKH